MLLDFSRLVLLTIVELLRRGGSVLDRSLARGLRSLRLPAWLAEAACARRMETMVRRLVAMGRKIELVRTELRAGRNVEAIAADREFRRMLAVVKADMRTLQCEAAAWQNDRHAAIASPRLAAALVSVASMSERIYCMADALLWELGERG